MSTAGAASTLAQRIDALLPQTQCGKCGYAGCRPYAEAIALGTAPINRCPPGGVAGIIALSQLLNVPSLPLDPACGDESPPQVARVVEELCIGCTLCIQACPVDAILGAPKLMHGVLDAVCTGCELCLPPCPVDCIELVPVPQRNSAQARAFADLSRNRYDVRNRRLADAQTAQAARHAKRQETLAAEERKRAAIERALARAQARLKSHNAG